MMVFVCLVLVDSTTLASQSTTEEPSPVDPGTPDLYAKRNEDRDGIRRVGRRGGSFVGRAGWRADGRTDGCACTHASTHKCMQEKEEMEGQRESESER